MRVGVRVRVRVRVWSGVEVHLHPPAEAGAVVVAQRLGVAERLQHGVSLRDSDSATGKHGARVRECRRAVWCGKAA